MRPQAASKTTRTSTTTAKPRDLTWRKPTTVYRGPVSRSRQGLAGLTCWYAKQLGVGLAAVSNSRYTSARRRLWVCVCRARRRGDPHGVDR